MIDYELQKSKRKSICLSVSKQGQVLVKAPLNMSIKEIEQFLNKHQAWVSARLEQVKSIVPLSRERVKEMIQRAKVEIPLRVEYFSSIMEVTPSSVKITSAQTRWGSCSGKNALCFSYRIMLLPDDLVDYIVVHELAHIRQKNHSSKFYDEVGHYLCDYKERIAKLKDIQRNIP